MTTWPDFLHLYVLLGGPLNCELFTAEKYAGKDSVELLLGIIMPKNCTLAQAYLFYLMP
jgi:hypothetical protein